MHHVFLTKNPGLHTGPEARKIYRTYEFMAVTPQPGDTVEIKDQEGRTVNSGIVIESWVDTDGRNAFSYED